jgi:hypothetical protein
MRLRQIRLRPLKPLQDSRELCGAPTLHLPAIRPRITLPSSITKRFTEPSRPYRAHRHILMMSMVQVLYATLALFIGGVAYEALNAQPVYRVVSLVVIAILWANAASIVARRKSVDAMETIEHPALKVFAKKRQQKALYMESTNVFLKAIKTSFIEKSNEIH